MGHETLFTRAARRGLLDRLTARLVHFIDEVLASQERFQHPEFEDRVDLIRRNCRVLLVGSVSEHPQRFSRQFRQHLARQWPLSFRACRRLRRRALKRWNKAAIRLRARGECRSAITWTSGRALMSCGAVQRSESVTRRGSFQDDPACKVVGGLSCVPLSASLPWCLARSLAP